jgi:hypothetical protein
MTGYADEDPDTFADTTGLVIPCWLCGVLAKFAHDTPENWATFKSRGPTCDTCWEVEYPRLQKEALNRE